MNNNLSVINYAKLSRRRFIKNAAKTGGILLAAPVMSRASNFIKVEDKYTVKQIIDLFISTVPGGTLKETVDTLKSGSANTVVTGILTTMFATVDMIRKAIDLGANFIIAHEPTFYNHEDKTSWLEDSDVYKYKADLLKQHGITVWRNHDYIHHLVPDGVITGVLEQLDWAKYADNNSPNIITLPTTPLKDIIKHAKEKLTIEKVRFIGKPEQPCTKVLLIPGAAGGTRQIEAMIKEKPDVLICGEISEWETAEYVRDAQAEGKNLSLVVLGHIASEEAGSVFMLNWLKKNVPSVKATHIPCGNSLSFM
jgi:putative NIF3 family GTP cyclohydrolase 1 type 2